jgi:ferredoxin
MKVSRKIIEIDEELCDGCGQCVPSCAEGALEIVNGKAKVIADKFCDGLGACLGECPTGALCIIEREADEFDEEAVEAFLAKKETIEEKQDIACGCPSTQIQTFVPIESHPEVQISSEAGVESALSHWPVQIRLVPPKAPFLKGADLLVLADCVSVAYANLHKDLINGKVVMMGCPKFDDAQSYIDKFAQIFKAAGIKSITTVYMEVPCCSGLPMIISKGLEASGQTVPITDIVISTRGKVLKQN